MLTAAVAQCSFLISLALTSAPAGDEFGPEVSDLARQVQQVDGQVFADPASRRRLAEMLSADVRRRRRAANDRESTAWSLIRSREEWERFRNARLDALRQSLGEPLETRPALNVMVTGTLRGDGYQIENLVFESRPGLLVTANLYSPSPPRESLPGILICHSHHNPKTQSELQEMGIEWARQGCLVLVMDQLGHGERRQHPFRTEADYAGGFRPSRQDYYFRYNVGMQLHVIGESLIGWMAWDLMCGVDLLLSRRDVDPSRIILLGAVAGGGDPAAVTAALDERIAAVVPFNFGGPQPETVYPLPPDAATSFDYAGGGSWESTRNLRLSARDGFAPWVIVGSVAPRRLVYAHEFAWDQRRDPVWRRLQTIFDFYGVPQHLAETHGQGSVRGQGLENTHCNNIGPVHRVAIHAAFERWFHIATPPREELPRHTIDELTCLTPAALEARSVRPLHQLAGELGAKRAAAARKRLDQLGPLERRGQLRRDWGRLLGSVEPRRDPRVIATTARSGDTLSESGQLNAIVERLALEVEPEIVVPLILLLPVARGAKPAHVVVAVAQHGKQAFLRERADTIAELLSVGIAVCLPDLRGTGETSPDDGRGRSSAATSLSSSELMLGQTLLGSRVRDLRSVLRYLRTRGEIDARRVALWGDSFAASNPRDRDLAAPLDAQRLPQHAEPLGGLAVLLTALFENEVRAVYARGGIAGFQSVTDSPFIYLPHDCIVPGALTAGDLCAVAAALAPRPLRLNELVDGQNRRLSDPEATSALAPVQRAYEAADGSARFSLLDSQSATVGAWLHRALEE
jgi:dienelactone hydrolase